MAESIFIEGLKAVTAGINPVQMKNGIERAVSDITDKLHKMSISIKSEKEMAQVGTVARQQRLRKLATARSSHAKVARTA